MSQAMKIRHSKNTGFFDLQDRLTFVNRLLAIVLITLTIIVSVPLSVKTFQEGGGPWGFGIMGLHILLPLNIYFLFGVSALLKDEEYQWQIFVGAHLISLLVGFVGFVLFPILPRSILLAPALLAGLSIFFKRRLPIFLCIMLVLGILANVILLKWELDFGRAIPIMNLFHYVTRENP